MSDFAKLFAAGALALARVSGSEGGPVKVGETLRIGALGGDRIAYVPAP